MSNHWTVTCSEMYATCYKMRNNFPVPASCSDEQLTDFLKMMVHKWSVNDDLISSGKAAAIDDMIALDGRPEELKTWEETLVEQCCYYENMIEELEYEKSRRTWLK